MLHTKSNTPAGCRLELVARPALDRFSCLRYNILTFQIAGGTPTAAANLPGRFHFGCEQPSARFWGENRVGGFFLLRDLMMNLTIGQGVDNPQGKSLDIARNAEDLMKTLTALPSQSEAWWSLHSWRGGRRSQANWEKSEGLIVDLDYKAPTRESLGKFIHTTPPTEHVEQFRNMLQLKLLHGNLAHLTPRGARIVLLFAEALTDAAEYEAYAKVYADILTATLKIHALEAYAVDFPALNDVARLYYTPNAVVKGVVRNSKIFWMHNRCYTLNFLNAVNEGKDHPAFTHAALGLPFVPGERDTNIHSAASKLAFLRPSLTTKAVESFFEPCVAAMHQENTHDSIPMSKVVDSYDRGVQAAQRKIEDLKQKKIDDANDPIYKLFSKLCGATTTAEKYSNAELEAIAEKNNCSLRQLRQLWIIAHKKYYYLLSDKGYSSAVTREELPIAFRDELARAPVAFTWVNDAGKEVELQFNSVLKRYATRAESVTTSLLAQASFFDSKERLFVEAACPLRKIVPAYDEKIQMWLELLGGKYKDKLLDWVASITQLDRPTCAIYFAGVKSAGKTMFAEGLAKLWTAGGTTKIDQMLDSSFNGAIVRCPVVFADEHIPSKNRAKISADIRAMIGTTEFSLRRKYLPDTTIKGAVRVILAANNDQLLDTKEDLTLQDQRAYAERVLIIRVDEKPAEYLRSLKSYQGTEDWVHGKQKIAAHALWLRENRKVVSQARWLVEGVAEDLHERLAVSSGIAGSIVEWFARYFDDPERVQHNPNQLPKIIVGNGQILVQTQVISDNWLQYISTEKTPTLAAVGRVLRTLADNPPKIAKGPSGNRRYYWSIRPSILLSWAEQNMIGSPEVFKAFIDQKIKIDSEDDT